MNETCENCIKLTADKKRLLALVQSWVQKHQTAFKENILLRNYITKMSSVNKQKP